MKTILTIVLLFTIFVSSGQSFYRARHLRRIYPCKEHTVVKSTTHQVISNKEKMRMYRVRRKYS